jgi:hypothetical protein
VRNEEVLHSAKEKRNVLHTVKRRKANWIADIVRRNCLLKHIIEGKTEGGIEVSGRQGRRCKKVKDDLTETRGYWKLEEAALGRTLWRLAMNEAVDPS